MQIFSHHSAEARDGSYWGRILEGTYPNPFSKSLLLHCWIPLLHKLAFSSLRTECFESRVQKIEQNNHCIIWFFLSCLYILRPPSTTRELLGQSTNIPSLTRKTFQSEAFTGRSQNITLAVYCLSVKPFHLVPLWPCQSLEVHFNAVCSSFREAS